MRFAALFLFATLPVATMAEEFTATSTPGSVTVYATGALVTRQLSLDLPEGAHVIVLPDLPQNLRADLIRVSVNGAVLNGTRYRANALPPQPDLDTPEIRAAKALIEEIEGEIQVVDDAVATIGLRLQAANAQLGFLAKLGEQRELPSDATALQAIAQMIGTQTLNAQEQILAAQRDTRAQEDLRNDLTEKYADAKAALAALIPRSEARGQLSLDVLAEQKGAAQMTVTYPVEAYWQPVYDVYLTEEGEPAVTLKRGAQVTQFSGENWTNVALSLSTLSLSEQSAPSTLYPRQLRLIDREAKQARSVSRLAAPTAESSGAYLSDEAPAPLEAAEARVSFDGPGVSYLAPGRISVASGADAARVALDTLEFPARAFARAVPLRDSTAFLMADLTNSTQEPLLYADSATWFVGNTQVAIASFPQIPAGDQADLPFGSIQGLRLTRVTLDRSEGDRGLLGRSNARQEDIRIDVQNLTLRDWPIEVIDQVPYAEDEDINLNWSARPAPTEEDRNDARGVLSWIFDIAAGETRSISLSQDIRWPEGQILR